MTDYRELIEELREQARLEDEYPEDAVIKRRAADALEAQAREISQYQVDVNEALLDCKSLRARIADLEAEVRFAYLECEDAVQCYDYEADLLRTDFEGLSENVRHMIKAMRDTAIPKNRYQNITDNQAAWQRMLAARAALKGEAK